MEEMGRNKKIIRKDSAIAICLSFELEMSKEGL
jgi:hypothetical protein